MSSKSVKKRKSATVSNGTMGERKNNKKDGRADDDTGSISSRTRSHGPIEPPSQIQVAAVSQFREAAKQNPRLEAIREASQNTKDIVNNTSDEIDQYYDDSSEEDEDEERNDDDDNNVDGGDDGGEDDDDDDDNNVDDNNVDYDDDNNDDDNNVDGQEVTNGLWPEGVNAYNAYVNKFDAEGVNAYNEYVNKFNAFIKKARNVTEGEYGDYSVLPELCAIHQGLLYILTQMSTVLTVEESKKKSGLECVNYPQGLDTEAAFILRDKVADNMDADGEFKSDLQEVIGCVPTPFIQREITRVISEIEHLRSYIDLHGAHLITVNDVEEAMSFWDKCIDGERYVDPVAGEDGSKKKKGPGRPPGSKTSNTSVNVEKGHYYCHCEWCAIRGVPQKIITVFGKLVYQSERTTDDERQDCFYTYRALWRPSVARTAYRGQNYRDSHKEAKKKTAPWCFYAIADANDFCNTFKTLGLNQYVKVRLTRAGALSTHPEGIYFRSIILPVKMFLASYFGEYTEGSVNTCFRSLIVTLRVWKSEQRETVREAELLREIVRCCCAANDASVRSPADPEEKRRKNTQNMTEWYSSQWANNTPKKSRVLHRMIGQAASTRMHSATVRFVKQLMNEFPVTSLVDDETKIDWNALTSALVDRFNNFVQNTINPVISGNWVPKLIENDTAIVRPDNWETTMSEVKNNYYDFAVEEIIGNLRETMKTHLCDWKSFYEHELDNGEMRISPEQVTEQAAGQAAAQGAAQGGAQGEQAAA